MPSPSLPAARVAGLRALLAALALGGPATEETAPPTQVDGAAAREGDERRRRARARAARAGAVRSVLAAELRAPTPAAGG